MNCIHWGKAAFQIGLAHLFDDGNWIIIVAMMIFALVIYQIESIGHQPRT